MIQIYFNYPVISEPLLITNNTFTYNFGFYGSNALSIRGYVPNQIINSNYFYRNYGCTNTILSTFHLTDKLFPVNEI